MSLRDLDLDDHLYPVIRHVFEFSWIEVSFRAKILFNLSLMLLLLLSELKLEFSSKLLFHGFNVFFIFLLFFFRSTEAKPSLDTISLGRLELFELLLELRFLSLLSEINLMTIVGDFPKLSNLLIRVGFFQNLQFFLLGLCLFDDLLVLQLQTEFLPIKVRVHVLFG